MRKKQGRRHKGSGITSTDGKAGKVMPLTKKSTPVFKRQAKKPQRDDPPANMRPVAHAPVEASKSKERASRLRRLGHRTI